MPTTCWNRAPPSRPSTPPRSPSACYSCSLTRTSARQWRAARPAWAVPTPPATSSPPSPPTCKQSTDAQHPARPTRRHDFVHLAAGIFLCQGGGPHRGSARLGGQSANLAHRAAHPAGAVLGQRRFPVVRHQPCCRLAPLQPELRHLAQGLVVGRPRRLLGVPHHFRPALQLVAEARHGVKPRPTPQLVTRLLSARPSSKAPSAAPTTAVVLDEKPTRVDVAILPALGASSWARRLVMATPSSFRRVVLSMRSASGSNTVSSSATCLRTSRISSATSWS